MPAAAGFGAIDRDGRQERKSLSGRIFSGFAAGSGSVRECGIGAASITAISIPGTLVTSTFDQASVLFLA